MGTPGCPYIRGVYIFMTPVEMPVSEDVSLTTPIGEKLEMNYEVHELPS